MKILIIPGLILSSIAYSATDMDCFYQCVDNGGTACASRCQYSSGFKAPERLDYICEASLRHQFGWSQEEAIEECTY